MTKRQILQKLKIVDDRLLENHSSKYRYDFMLLKKTELEKLLEAFETVDTLFNKCKIGPGMEEL